MTLTIKCPLCERELKVKTYPKEMEFSRTGRVLVEFATVVTTHDCAGTPEPGPLAA